MSYWANIRVRIGNAWYGPGMSSFFPWKWKQEDIVRWIEQALTSPPDSDRPTRQDWTTNPRAIRRTDTGGQLRKIIVNRVSCSVLYQGREIASIYPNVPGFPR
jgi:Bacterial EndoU nuclease